MFAKTADERRGIWTETVTLVISSCSKRKRGRVDPALRAGALPECATASVAIAWGERLRAAAATTQAKELYAGRAFNEAACAAKRLGARLAIVSAGLGLVDGSTLSPVYSLTTARRDPDNILLKTGGTASQWWMALQAQSPYRSTAVGEEAGLILAALPSSYIDMVAEEWSQWPEDRKARLRLFSKEAPQGNAAGLLQAWMPYDDRLDAVGSGHAGTQGDFAQRALRHFAETMEIQGGLDQHRTAVERSLEGLTKRIVPVRLRRSDSELRALILAEWGAVEGRSAAMLRHFRDTLGIACEQSRFKDLFNAIAYQKDLENAP